MIVIVCGVCGCGKTTLARELSARLACPFVEGDDLHPVRNVEKMTTGRALDDDDRLGWLLALSEAAVQAQHAPSEGSIPVKHTVVTCSALKRAYRDLLRSKMDSVFFVALEAHSDARALLLDRMVHRDHFMPPALLDSQLATWQPLQADERGMTLDATAAVHLLLARVISVVVQ